MLQVNFEDTKIKIIESNEHIFLLSSKEVAKGYGVVDSTIREHKRIYQDELIEGKHFVVGKNANNANKTMWTKRGVVRLGFFIKSERAKAFRDWAEDYVVDKANDTNYVPYELLYAKERECIELKRAMNRITENTPFILNDPQTHNDTLEFLGYASRAAKTMRQLASDTAEYAENMERFIASIQKRHGNIKGVTTQCNRLPRHKEKKD
jgi:hypothetical protein